MIVKADFNGDGVVETDLIPYLNVAGQDMQVQQGAAIDGTPLTSEITLTLRNTSGIFSPRNTASSLYGPKARALVKIQGTHNATTYDIWQGYIRDQRWSYEVGQNRGRYQIQCRDLISMIANQVVTIQPSTSYDVDGALAAVFTACGLSASDYDLTTDSPQDLPLFFALNGRAGDLIGQLLLSEMIGSLYCAPSGKPTFESRTTRLGVTLDATPPANVAGQGTTIIPYHAEEEERDEDLVTKVTISPTKYSIGSGGVVVMDAGYRPSGSDPNARQLTLTPNQVVGPTQVIPNRNGIVTISGVPSCVANVDYFVNSATDGSGSDRSGEVTISFTQPYLSLGSDAYYYTITNGAAHTNYVIGLQVRAVAITDASGRASATETNSSGTGTDDASTGTITWTNPSRVAALDSSYAAVSLTAGQSSHYLKVTLPMSNVPSNAEITGVQFDVSCKDAVQTTQTMRCRLLKGGTILTAKSNTATISTTQGYITMGGPAELWSTTLTPADTRDPSFGCVLDIPTALADTYSVDHVKCTVYYTTDVGITTSNPQYSMELPISGLKGGRELNLQIPWVADDNTVRDFGYSLLRIGRYPSGRLRQRYQLGDDNTRQFALGAKPGKLIQYVSPTAHGVEGEQANDYYRVESRLLTFSLPGKLHEVELTLVPAYQFRNLAAIAWDDFNRPDTASTLGNTPTGKTWTGDTQMKISSNQAVPTTNLPNFPTFDLGAGKTDIVAECSFSGLTTTAYAGIVYRYSNTSNFWRAEYLGNTTTFFIRLVKVVAGVTTVVGSNYSLSAAPTSGELRVIVQGNRHRVWWNRTLTHDQTDSSINTNTQVGIRLRETANAADNFYVQALT